jgi:uncharacterized protein (DUF433 family)
MFSKNSLPGSFLIVLTLMATTTTGVFASSDMNAADTASLIAPPPRGEFKLSDDALDAVADVLGITTDELTEALDDGTTLEDLAESADVDVEDVYDAIRESMPEPPAGFAGGRERSLQSSGNFGALETGHPAQLLGQLPMSDETLEAIADLLDISVDDLQEALKDGTSIEELAESADIDVEDILEAIKEYMPEGVPGLGNLQFSEQALKAIANLLDMTVDELKEALEDKTTLEELAESADIDVQDIYDAIRDLMPANGMQNGQPGQNPDSQQAQNPGVQPEQNPGNQTGQNPGGQPGQFTGGQPGQQPGNPMINPR